MSALPVMPVPPLAPEHVAPLSQAARIIDTFIAPSKTFTDLRRSASWWAPFLLMVIVSAIFIMVGGQKVGFRKILENQLRTQPKQQAQLEQMSPDEREKNLQVREKATRVFSYAFPAIQLLILVIIAAVLFATFKFAAGADVSFKVAMAIVVYASLPGLLKAYLAIISLLAGASPDSFTFQNPVATNPAYFMNPADSLFLYSFASMFDIFLIWTLVLTAIGFTCVSKVKRGTALGIVFGWWLFFGLILAGLGSLA